MNRKISFFIYPGFQLLDLSGPLAAFQVAAEFCPGAYTPRVAGMRTLLIGAAGCLIVLGPWMIAQHATSGTYYYPLLGKGFHYSSYGLYPPPSGFSPQIILRKVLPFNIPLLVILFIEWFWGEDDEQTRAIVTLTAATLVASAHVS